MQCTQPSAGGSRAQLYSRARPCWLPGAGGACCCAPVLNERVSPFQAQSSACSLQAELEKLRLAENAAASDMEEAQHLKVMRLSWSLVLGAEPGGPKLYPGRTGGMIYSQLGWWGKADGSQGRCSLLLCCLSSDRAEGPQAVSHSPLLAKLG